MRLFQYLYLGIGIPRLKYEGSMQLYVIPNNSCLQIMDLIEDEILNVLRNSNKLCWQYPRVFSASSTTLYRSLTVCAVGQIILKESSL